LNFYEDYAISLPADTGFVDHIHKVWKVEEDIEESEVFKEAIQGVIEIIRYKLIQHTRDSHDEYILRRIFQEFDTNKDGTLDLLEL